MNYLLVLLKFFSSLSRHRQPCDDDDVIFVGHFNSPFCKTLREMPFRFHARICPFKHFDKIVVFREFHKTKQHERFIAVSGKWYVQIAGLKRYQ